MLRKHLVAATAAATLAGGSLAGSVPAIADTPDQPSKPAKVSKLDRGLVSPLSLAVAENGTAYYSENFKGTLLMKRPGKKPRPIYQNGEGAEVGAVSERRGALRFALTISPQEEGGEAGAVLMGIGNSGKARPLADLHAYEKTKNPDGNVTYGFRSLPDGCEVPEFLQGYPGIVESHPYATLQARGGTFIADAAGNTILKLGRGGRLSTVAVLPAQPLVVTEAVVEALKGQGVELPECTLGRTVYLEAVPTDVEKGPDGKLYVTTLPGGPEDPSLGARAAVYRVDPRTGRTKKVAGGLLSATGVAVDRRGTLFVSELFGDRIAKVKVGKSTPTTYLRTAMPGDVEIRTNGDLYATTQVLFGPQGPEDPTPPGGQVVRIRR